jgi:hypothetical protein
MSGRSTYSGTNFQAAIGAYLAGLMLAEEPLRRLADGLPGYPRLVQLETLSGVDDVLVHTDLGRVFFQVKTTLPLSVAGALASVADQFVQQYRNVIHEPGVRPLDARWDRLVLAVSSYAPASITENLREGLDRNRTRAVSVMPVNYQKALSLFSGLLDAAWLHHAGKLITATERQAILNLCMVVPITDLHRQVVEQTLTAVVAAKGAEAAVMDCLITWAADVAARGTGGDSAAVRLALTGKVTLLEPPSYQQDVARLRTHTTDTLHRLGRFTTLNTTAGPIHLERPAADALTRVALGCSVALTGEPGAGKSAILWTVAHTLAKEHPVVCLTVSGGATSLDTLRRDLQLEHPLPDVLREVAATRPAFLLLDALDAARGGAAELTYRQLLEAVESLPNWRVIASVRTFDLRMGKAWQALFPGEPPDSAYAGPGFGRVRHFHLGLLTAAERAALEHRAPELHEALVASGAKVEKLARNPFNLDLLAELLRLGTSAADLARVATRGQLLRRYWDTRIEVLGTASFLGLSSLVKQMLKARALAVPLGMLKPSTGEAIDHLLRAGVLQREDPDRIEFRHHVLFDYAVARLALLNNSKADKYLHKRHTAGLLLAPSLGYWLEELRLDSSPPTYWNVVTDLIGNDEVDPVVRVEVTRLTIEALTPADRLTELASFFAAPGPDALRGFRLFVSALAARVAAKEEFAVEPWAHLLDALGTPPDTHLRGMQILLESLLGVCHDPAATAALGRAARTLYARICQDEELSGWLSKSVVGNVARTYATDPAASHQALVGIFAPDRLALVGFLEVPALAHHLLEFAESGPELVVQLYHNAFQHHTFRHEGHTTLSRSYIMSISMDPQDAYRLAEYELVENYPILLTRFPVTGIRALAAALEGARLRYQVVTRALRPPVVGVAGKMYTVEEDGSMCWAEDIEAPHGPHYATLYQRYHAQLPALPLVLLSARLPALLLGESRAALVWRVLFETGTAHPAALGEVLWAAAASSHVLVTPGTRRSAITFLAAAYPVMPRARLEDAEHSWLARAFDSCPDAESVRLLTLGELFQTIGEAQLVTEEARAFLRRAATAHSLANDALVNMGSYHPNETPWRPRATLPDTEAPTGLGRGVRAVAGARQAAERDPSSQNINHLQQALAALDDASHPADFDGGDLTTVAPALVLVLARLSRNHFWRGRAAEWLVALAREAAATGGPAPAEETHPVILGSPRGPVAVAQALAEVAALTGGWSSVAACVEELLLNAAHPAVRSELAEVLPALTRDHEETAWELTGRFVTRETHPVVLRQAFRAVDCLTHLNAGRAEELLLQLSVKTATSSPSNDVVTGRVVQLGLGDGRAASLGLLYAWIPQFAREKDHLHAVLYCLRDLFATGYGATPHQDSAIASRTRAFVLALLEALEPLMRPLATLKRKATPDEVVANELFTGVAGQLFFGVGRSEFTSNLVKRDAQQHFLRDYAPIMVRLARLGDPKAIDYLTMTISRFIAAAPQLSFDLFSEALLHNTGVANYEEEPQGARQFVAMVTTFLSGHQYLFAGEDRRNKLIACLALFLNVGWPEAWPLFIHLRDMQQ